MDEVKKFKELLERSLKKLPQKDLAIAFSGGLDSSVMAKAMLNLGLKFKGYVVGLKNSRDLKQAKKVAEEIGLKLIVIEITSNDVENAIPIERDILKSIYDQNKKPQLDPNPIPISFNLPFYFIAKNAKEKNILLAQGPDEMLGGYTRHQTLGKKEAEAEMRENLSDFVKFGVLQNIETGKNFGKTFYFPFLEKEVVDFCLDLGFEHKINEGVRKVILRKLALEVGLNKEVAYQPKKAAQYGSGIIWEMKRIAKKKGVHISRYVKEAEKV